MSESDLRVTLPAELAEAIGTAVATGEFATPADAVGAAVRDWKERRENWGYTLDELRAEISKGLESGPAHLTSMDEVKREARRRFESRISRSA